MFNFLIMSRYIALLYISYIDHKFDSNIPMGLKFSQLLRTQIHESQNPPIHACILYFLYIGFTILRRNMGCPDNFSSSERFIPRPPAPSRQIYVFQFCYTLLLESKSTNLCLFLYIIIAHNLRAFILI